MPLIHHSSYQAPILFKNPHMQSIYPILFRPNWRVRYYRERIETVDKDFLDLDWSFVGSKRLAILTHGLEGHSGHAYMLGMAKALNRRGITALAWNFRGCSGELNRREYFYHVGMSSDLAHVVDHVKSNFDEIYLIGFSLGGNMTIKYLGEHASKLSPRIKCAVNFSAPIDLQACSHKVSAQQNWVYFRKFMWTIQQKIAAKSKYFQMPASLEQLKKVSSFKELDELFTAPLFGFISADELWQVASSVPYISEIRIPTLLVTAADDPLLTLECYPTELAHKSEYFYFESPKNGGHVGFVSFNRQGEYWSEKRALQFIDQQRVLGTKSVLT